MKMVTDRSCRQVTFSKRRTGLFKKANELATLCAVDRHHRLLPRRQALLLRQPRRGARRRPIPKSGRRTPRRPAEAAAATERFWRPTSSPQTKKSVCLPPPRKAANLPTPSAALLLVSLCWSAIDRSLHAPYGRASAMRRGAGRRRRWSRRGGEVEAPTMVEGEGLVSERL
ncbi:unnamed protein product [Linum tenue]|uniref:MADS-box domain-containing protein n=1 Tax=Linum tenue TaxID=586396 RepID=A0AAV0JZ57_9ROSI|nr:unnamed protein product [Linum tenue]